MGLFLFGLIVPGINNWGHGGGLLGGIVLGLLLGYREQRPENLLHKFLAALCLLASAVSLILGLLSAWSTFAGQPMRSMVF